MKNPPTNPEGLDRLNRKLLSALLGDLRDSGHIEYKGEYGAEITTFIPLVAWLHTQGLLEGRFVRTYRGMRPYYFFLADEQFEEKPEDRVWLPVVRRYWPSNSTYSAVKSEWHYFHDFRSHYRKSSYEFSKPLIFIQNKFTIEWGRGPINFIPLWDIRKIFEQTKHRYNIVYSRPGIFNIAGYAPDANLEINFPDKDIISQYDHVLCLEEHCTLNSLDYNTEKLRLLARSFLYIAAQGGGAHAMALFNNALMLVLDRSEDLAPDGSEYPHAYHAGAYKYLASPAPTLMVARSYREFSDGTDVILNAAISENGISLPRPQFDIMQRLAL